MTHLNKKKQKGSVFVTFETNEQMKSFMALEEVKHQDQVLNRETQYVLKLNFKLSQNFYLIFFSLFEEKTT